MSRKKDNYDQSRWLKFKNWVDGDVDLLAKGMEARVPDGNTDGSGWTHGAQSLEAYEAAQEEELKKLPIFAKGFDPSVDHGLALFRKFYRFLSVLLCGSLILVLLWTVAYLPIFGNAGNPDNNEVSARYIERGLQETGAVIKGLKR